MWMLWSTLAVMLPILGLVAYEEWRNKRIDKYNEWVDQQKAMKDSSESA
jgi:hypothetical protein